MPNTIRPSLSQQETEAARELWNALVFASSKEARTQLSVAPEPIQRAVIHEIVRTLRQGLEFQDRGNPFD